MLGPQGTARAAGATAQTAPLRFLLPLPLVPLSLSCPDISGTSAWLGSQVASAHIVGEKGLCLCPVSAQGTTVPPAGPA